MGEHKPKGWYKEKEANRIIGLHAILRESAKPNDPIMAELHGLCIASGHSFRWIEDRANLSIGTLNKVFRNRGGIQMKTYRRILNALGYEWQLIKKE